MKKLIFCLLILFFLIGAKDYKIYFEGSDHCLEEIKITGEKSGPVALIFGGIHGDEPGSYFSAELIEHIILKNGTIIVFPRVNFPSIMLNRREIHGDMNRKFIDKKNVNDPDAEVIELLKKKMGEADVFINLHDAYGFHRRKKYSQFYGPEYYGQSLIFDTTSFFSPRWNREFNLEIISEAIVKRINAHLPEKFCFESWNHRSVEKDTRFPEMKKSATYYALTKYKIPAFGLEISKNLPSLYLKVRYQLLAIAEILKAFDFDCSVDGLDYFPPELYFVELKKGNQAKIRINDKTIVRLRRGEQIQIDGIFGNSRSGYSADIVDFGNLNDIGKKFIFEKDKKVIIRKNNQKIGEIYFRQFNEKSLQKIYLNVNGKDYQIENWGVFRLNNDSVRIKIALQSEPDFSEIELTDFDRKPIDLNREINSCMIDLSQQKHFHLLAGIRSYIFYLYFKKSLIGGFQIDLQFQ